MFSLSKRVAVALAAAALPLSLATAANPAAAIPPHAEETVPLLEVFPDLDNRLAVYLNTTRETFCAWEAAGFVGEPPLLKELSPAWEWTTGTGEVSGVLRDELHLELWPLDADAALVSSCEDTSEATGPFATGRADVRATGRGLYDTDDGHGANAENLGFQAVLTGSDGSRYRYHVHGLWVFDGKGRVRHLGSGHFRLISLP
jgi:hypothetical protein